MGRIATASITEMQHSHFPLTDPAYLEAALPLDRQNEIAGETNTLGICPQNTSVESGASP